MMEHLIAIENLDKSEILALVKMAKSFEKNLLESSSQGKTVAMMFCENSTRTKCSFEIAAKNLKMNVLNFDTASSSFSKGESLKDTIENLYEIGVDAVVIRHSISGIIDNIIPKIRCPIKFINAGDGHRAHPTQALLDFYTMLDKLGTVENKKIVIAGDISHSRVAKSNVALLKKFNANLHLCSPEYLKPKDVEKLGVTYHSNLEEAISGADAVMVLRVQNERHDNYIYPSALEYKRQYNINSENLKRCAKDNVILMHPGPVNRDVELSSELMDSQKGLTILEQARNGVFVRMAVLNTLLGGVK
jgi:aspartate carbamoyltransferase catalytic subunit